MSVFGWRMSGRHWTVVVESEGALLDGDGEGLPGLTAMGAASLTEKQRSANSGRATSAPHRRPVSDTVPPGRHARRRSVGTEIGRLTVRLGQYVIAVAAGTVALIGGYEGAHAATTVKVELQDTSTSDAVKGMQIKLDRSSAAAGKVRFLVANESKSLVHEMIVIKADVPASALPY